MSQVAMFRIVRVLMGLFFFLLIGVGYITKNAIIPMGIVASVFIFTGLWGNCPCNRWLNKKLRKSKDSEDKL